MNQVSISEITSIKNEALKEYFQTLRTKNLCCVKHKDCPLIQYATLTVKQLKFMKTVRKAPIEKVPENSNIITYHLICKFKENDGGSLKMKAKIAAYEN